MDYMSLSEIIKILTPLVDLVRGAIGEQGKAVMINTHSPRQTVVTKSGIDIVESLRGTESDNIQSKFLQTQMVSKLFSII